MRACNAVIALAAATLLCACSAHTTAPRNEQVGSVPLFPGLGNRSRPVTTDSPQAQRYFDQGLSFLYGFNQDEAIRSFTKAAELDPDCAMAWWGIATANGPHINNPAVPPENAATAWSALQTATALASSGTDVEQALIRAQAARWADPPPEDRSALDTAYADAMREVWRRFPRDADVGALFAESLMDLHPWDQWTREGAPQPGTEEVVTTLEAAMALDPTNPLAAHLYIHAVEASPDPGRANAAADRLRDLQPGLGHLVHMPSHIDIRCGRWQQAVVANTKAIEADRTYRALSPHQGFYGLYMAHDNHMLAYAAMMSGQRDLALRVTDELVAAMPEDWTVEYAAIADGYMVMPLEVRMRFGMWNEILVAPELAERFPFARAMRHYARGVAYAAQGDVTAARSEQAAFRAAREKVPPEAFFGNNAAADLLAVAEDLLEGEILYREGKHDAAVAALRQAVVHEDALRYDEPPGWIQPTRHALGAILLKTGRNAEAEVVFREDLEHLPENGWGLYGLTISLERQGKTTEAARTRARFEKVWALSDVDLATPCFCEPRV